jgi:hypothetical protein
MTTIGGRRAGKKATKIVWVGDDCKTKELIGELIDVMNFCMMTIDQLGGLDDVDLKAGGVPPSVCRAVRP